MPKRDGKGSSLDGNALRTQRTRCRVLAESLRLFNELGEAQVATGTIAEALDMSPGNLYYHFRNKDQIIDELFAQFEERIDVQPNPRGRGAEAIEDLWLYLHLMLEAIWEYRFLYRNLDDLLGRNRKLREHFARIVERKYQVVLALFETLERARALRGRPEELRALARNVLLVATYWLNFSALGGWRDPRAAEGAQVGQGAYQVMALIAPFLMGEAKAHLESLSRSYID